MNKSNLKTVAIIGRPNVGKSTLFNRLIGRREAIEAEVPGTTRDRLFGEVSWGRQRFALIDVAGLDFGSKGEIEAGMQQGIELAMEESDLIIFLVDWTEKDNETDKRIARMLRNNPKPVIMAINKADNVARINDIDSFKRLGDFEAIPVSSISGLSSGDLLDLILKKLSKVKKEKVKVEKDNGKNVRLAIIGRPNVGKSTLLNAIIGEKRAITSNVPGTTRDVLSVFFHKDAHKINLLDTAGIRRPGKIEKDTIESFAVLRTQRAIKESDVVVLLVDAEEGLVASDLHILGDAQNFGKGLILAVNKIDLWKGDPKEEMARILTEYQTRLNFMPWLPIVFVSAKDSSNINAILNQVVTVFQNRETKIDDATLTEILAAAKEANLQLIGLKSFKQKKNRPPIFELFYTGRKPPHKTQIRYLENKLRDSFPMNGSPVFIDLVANPYIKKTK